MRGLKLVVAGLACVSILIMFTSYSGAQGSDRTEMCSLEDESAFPDVAVTVVNELTGVEVTVKEVALRKRSHEDKELRADSEEGCGVVKRHDYHIILGATKTCFPAFMLDGGYLGDFYLEVLVSYASSSAGESDRRDVVFRYNLQEALLDQLISIQHNHIATTLVLLETEDGECDADWLVAGS